MSNNSTKHSEWLTRKRLIDPKLEAAGWRVVPFYPGQSLKNYERCAVEEFPTDNGPADYALCVGAGPRDRRSQEIVALLTPSKSEWRQRQNGPKD